MSDLGASLWLDQAVGHHVKGDLDKMEALAVTAKIKGYVGVTWILIAEAHNRKAHKALGYGTWGEYVEAEFDMSRSRSYQLISQARVVLEISEAVSTMVDISEREARDLAPFLDAAKSAAADAVDALDDDATPEDKSAAVTDALDKLRSAAVDAARPKATQTHTVTETTTTTFDPETGEILSPTGDSEAPSGSDQSDGASPDAAGPDDDHQEHDEDAPSSASGASPAPKVAPPSHPIDPTLGYRARATAERSKVRNGLLTLDAQRVMETTDDPQAWIQFASDLLDFVQDLKVPGLRAVN